MSRRSSITSRLCCAGSCMKGIKLLLPKYNNLMKRFMIQFNDILFEDLLVLLRVRRLIQHCIIFPYLKEVRFDPTHNSKVGFTNSKFYFNYTFFIVYCVHKLWFVYMFDVVCQIKQTTLHLTV